jgi:hypothetical protein
MRAQRQADYRIRRGQFALPPKLALAVTVNNERQVEPEKKATGRLRTL